MSPGRWKISTKLNYIKKSRIRETKNLSTDADSRTDTITFFHQVIAGDGRVLIEETEFWWPSGTHFFFSSGDCRWLTSSLRRQTGFALIEETEFWWQSRTHFFIRKLQVMDEFFKETGWLCSWFFCQQEIAGDGRVLWGDRLALLPWDLLCSPGRIAWGGDTIHTPYGRTSRLLERIGLRVDSLKSH